MTLGTLKPWETPEIGRPAAFAERLRALIPVLETEQLILRAPVMEDFAPFAEIEMSDRAIYMDGPLNREDTWLDWSQCLSSWILNGYGMWTVTSKLQEVLGFVTITRGYGDMEPELGYFFLETATGHGFATEAVIAARNFGISEIGVASLVSYIDARNAASIAVAERVGGLRDVDAEASFKGTEYEADLVYRHWPRGANHPPLEGLAA